MRNRLGNIVVANTSTGFRRVRGHRSNDACDGQSLPVCLDDLVKHNPERRLLIASGSSLRFGYVVDDLRPSRKDLLNLSSARFRRTWRPPPLLASTSTSPVRCREMPE